MKDTEFIRRVFEVEVESVYEVGPDDVLDALTKLTDFRIKKIAASRTYPEWLPEEESRQ
jgi:hypothetical protein